MLKMFVKPLFILILNSDMDDFYDRLEKHKVANRLSNKELGKILEMEGEAFRVACVRQSLSTLQKKELLQLFEKDNNETAISAVNTEEEAAVNYILSRPELRNSNPRFKVYCDLLAAEAKLEYMEKRYGNG